MAEKKSKPRPEKQLSVRVRDLDPGEGPTGGATASKAPSGVTWDGPEFDAIVIKQH